MKRGEERGARIERALRRGRWRLMGMLAAWWVMGGVGAYFGMRAWSERLRHAAAEEYCVERTVRAAREIEGHLRSMGYEDWEAFETGRGEGGGGGLRLSSGGEVAYVFLVEPGGRIVAHSDASQEGTRVGGGVGEWCGRCERPVVRRLQVRTGGGVREVVDVGMGVKLGQDAVGMLRAGFDLETVLKYMPLGLTRELQKAVVGVVGLLGAGTLGTVWWVVGRLTKRVRREAEGLRREAERQMEVIGAGIVHEVKNALNGIHMNAQLISEFSEGLGDAERERLAKYARRITHEASRTGTMLNEFLSYARPAAFKPVLTNVAGLLEEVAQYFEHECRRRSINLRWEVGAELSCVRVDEKELRHAVTNLIWNAIDAVKEGGEIWLRGRREGKELVIEVSDTGGGIPLEIENRIFDVFFSTKPQGAGLGLSVVQRVARMHGGRVVLQNRPGQGCTFALRLPWRE